MILFVQDYSLFFSFSLESIHVASPYVMTQTLFILSVISVLRTFIHFHSLILPPPPFPDSHKAATILSYVFQSFANFPVLPHVKPFSLSSVLTSLCHVLFGQAHQFPFSRWSPHQGSYGGYVPVAF